MYFDFKYILFFNKTNTGITNQICNNVAYLIDEKKEKTMKKNLNNMFCFGFYLEGSMVHLTNIRFNSINDHGLIGEYASKEILW